MHELAQQLLNGLILGSIYALFAAGYTLVFGVLDVLNLAHSTVLTLGAVFAYSAIVHYDAPTWVAVIAAIVGTCLIGAVIEYAVLRPLRRRGAPQMAALIGTIGLGLIIIALLEQSKGGGILGWLWTDGPNDVKFPAGSVPTGGFHFNGITLSYIGVVIIVLSLTLMAGLGWLVTRTDFGRQMRAVAENPRAARLLGVDVDRVVLVTVMGSSALAGLAGVLYAVMTSDISPYMGRDQLELRGLAVIVLGGMGSVTGSVVGGYALGIVEVFALVAVGSNFRAAIAFGLLFVMLVARPQGLFGKAYRQRV